ncbi:TIR domain-containing protein [Opitutaceae bacterium]|nr:TIR domain-containing protein [Opitutaceae bacterium]
MSTANQAIFLSYASQDVGAASRIADALRNQGLEVWFDQNQLSGGDAWDKKIRDQINSCALFMPVISANTQERTEGYFRLEWRLAEQRTHLMAKGRPFLVPIVIDDTPDSQAHVPDAFLEVQWSRFNEGLVDAAFTQRAEELLSGEVTRQVFVDRPDLFPNQGNATHPSSGAKKPFPWWLLFALPGMVVGLFYAIAPLINSRSQPPPNQGPALPTLSPAQLESRQLAERAWSLLSDDPLMTRRSVELAEELALEATELDSTHADAFAAVAWANTEILLKSYEDTPERRATLREYAETAKLLDPDATKSDLAIFGLLLNNQRSEEAIALIAELVQRAPDDLLVLKMAATTAALLGESPESGEIDPVERIRNHSPRGKAYVESRMAGMYWGQGRYHEADTILDEIFAAGQANRLAYLTRLLILNYGWGDLDAAIEFSEIIPEKLLLEDVFIYHLFKTHYWRGDYDEALAVLDRTQRTMLKEAIIQEPIDLLRGDAMEMRGAQRTAQQSWVSALQLVDETLAANPRDFLAQRSRIELLARLDKVTEAEEEVGLMLETTPPQFKSRVLAISAEIYLRSGDIDKVAELLRPQLNRKSGRWPNAYNSIRYDPQLQEHLDHPVIKKMLEVGSNWLAELKAAGAPPPSEGTP